MCSVFLVRFANCSKLLFILAEIRHYCVQQKIYENCEEKRIEIAGPNRDVHVPRQPKTEIISLIWPELNEFADLETSNQSGCGAAVAALDVRIAGG